MLTQTRFMLIVFLILMFFKCFTASKVPIPFKATTARDSYCNRLKRAESPREGFEKGTESFDQHDGNLGQELVTITCRGSGPTNLVSIIVFQLNGTSFEVSTGSYATSTTLECSNDGYWFLPGLPNRPLTNLFLCEIKQLDAYTSKSNVFPSTMSPKIFTTTYPFSTTTFKIGVITAPLMNQQSKCNEFGFQLLSSTANRTFSAEGKFGGLYKYASKCRKLCKHSFGLFKCKAFMFEPRNHGKCTIFEHSIDGKITENTNSTGIVYRKCTIND